MACWLVAMAYRNCGHLSVSGPPCLHRVPQSKLKTLSQLTRSCLSPLQPTKFDSHSSQLPLDFQIPRIEYNIYIPATKTLYSVLAHDEVCIPSGMCIEDVEYIGSDQILDKHSMMDDSLI